MVLSALTSQMALAAEIQDSWKYTTNAPGEGWQAKDFAESGWQEGFGGFGTADTPGSRLGTRWETNDIWMRKAFDLEKIPARPALLIHHDEGAEVYINGELVAQIDGYTTEYQVIAIEDSKREVLKTGQNLMAVHCHQTAGGQFIDAHLVDADNVPDLPKPQRSSKPFVSHLITEWGEKVTALNAWTEYPRPQLQRDQWSNLNGHWNYAVTPIEQSCVPEEWDGNILVPFSLESRLGEVQRLLRENEALWYQREFDVCDLSSKRLHLNFEAVDYRCEVFVNGKSVGEHVGGNTPFSFDITDAVSTGINQLILRVEDATEAYQLRGKQVINARGIWYTQVSGIWQTVWLEETPEVYVKDLKIKTSLDGSVDVEIIPSATDAEMDLAVTAFLNGKQVAGNQCSTTRLNLQIDDPQLWSPDSPTLYDLEVKLNGDVVRSYFGIREVGKVKDSDGHWRFTLNGETIFHWGPLDQGWWPDGLLTPPSDEAMLFDIEWLKKAGFNMIRKHIKVEPRRYYYHCDRLGMMVWQDQVSGGIRSEGHWPDWTRLQPNPEDAIWPDEQHAQFMLELERMISNLENHPSIVCWVPFNEAWGQHRTVEVGKWTVQRDPSRLVNIASGGNFWPVGDIVDAHRYPHPGFPFELGAGGRFDDFIKVMGEFGGHGYPVPDHLWDASRRNWGYGGLPKNKEEYKERYLTSLRMLNELREQGIAAGVYTQTTDVEGEINGLMTYDRKVIKIPAEELAELHRVLFE